MSHIVIFQHNNSLIKVDKKLFGAFFISQNIDQKFFIVMMV